jgi:uncharacterized protein
VLGYSYQGYTCCRHYSARTACSNASDIGEIKVAGQFKGIAFPFQWSATSFPGVAEDEDLVRQSIVQILTTPKGQRVMRPEFGTNILDYIFENNDDNLQNRVGREVREAIALFEPRVIVTAVNVERDDASVIVNVMYVLVATKSTQQASVRISGGQ